MFRLNRFVKPASILRRSLYTKTTLNANGIDIAQPNLDHKSLILLTTPPQLNNIVSNVIDKQATNTNISQILVVCIDSIADSRNGYSELWLETPFKVTHHETIEERNERIKKKVEPLSVDPIKFDKSWKDTTEQTLFQINLTNLGLDSKVRLANTLFENGENSTCFYIGKESYDWYNLAKVIVDVNLDNFSAVQNIEYANRLTEIPLVENVEEGADEELFTVTDFEGNLIKSINNQSASGYLIDNSIVMNSKKDLYFKLYDNETEDRTRPWLHEYYKLIVGGLGWGEKQAFLAVDPIVGTTGFRDVKLFFYDKDSSKHRVRFPVTNGNSKLVFECSELESGYEEYKQSTQAGAQETVVKPGVFAMGCEQGFELDGIWHRSNGEFVEIEVAQS
ncbi:hypothetical protein PMKS-003277 [Pichia membranifaciens]|uniref:FIST domain-containing protein n=1 Tax=Pichia membranifaciens TaxID=4926 RepID=A0A1Q2YJS6_9ASCO|nr:hypothetical protein PMKS-003277 [Pichia membranifaciens]